MALSKYLARAKPNQNTLAKNPGIAIMTGAGVQYFYTKLPIHLVNKHLTSEY